MKTPTYSMDTFICVNSRMVLWACSRLGGDEEGEVGMLVFYFCKVISLFLLCFPLFSSSSYSVPFSHSGRQHKG